MNSSSSFIPKILSVVGTEVLPLKSFALPVISLFESPVISPFELSIVSPFELPIVSSFELSIVLSFKWLIVFSIVLSIASPIVSSIVSFEILVFWAEGFFFIILSTFIASLFAPFLCLIFPSVGSVSPTEAFLRAWVFKVIAFGRRVAVEGWIGLTPLAHFWRSVLKFKVASRRLFDLGLELGLRLPFLDLLALRASPPSARPLLSLCGDGLLQVRLFWGLILLNAPVQLSFLEA